MGHIDHNLLKSFASKYIWWKTPDTALATPDAIIAQVMNIGEYEDVQSLVSVVGEEALRRALLHAEAGQFNERSWFYWHYRFGLAQENQVPPVPVRNFA